MNDSGLIAAILFGVLLIPAALAGIVGGGVFLVMWIRAHPIQLPPHYWELVAGVIAGFFLIGALSCILCYRVYPKEMFVGAQEGGDTTLLTEIAATEVEVCKLITRVDGFLQNDVGPAGQTDPGLVSEAQTRARAGIDMVACGGSGDASGEAAHRITRLEETLRSFTGPELQRTYDTAMKCEGFQGTSTPSLRDRLTAVQATLRDQQKRLLAPVDQKTEDLHRGIASDCDKRRGAAHMSAGGGAKT